MNADVRVLIHRWHDGDSSDTVMDHRTSDERKGITSMTMSNEEKSAYGRRPTNCPRCGREIGINNLKVHLAKHDRNPGWDGTPAHPKRPRSNGVKVNCDECGLPFARNYMGQHLRKAHNIFGGVSGMQRRKELKTRAKEHNRVEPGTLELIQPQRPAAEIVAERMSLHPSTAALLAAVQQDQLVWRESANWKIMTDPEGEEWICERMVRRDG